MPANGGNGNNASLFLCMAYRARKAGTSICFCLYGKAGGYSFFNTSYSFWIGSPITL